jgi:hypothetical protein
MSYNNNVAVVVVVDATTTYVATLGKSNLFLY